MQYTVCVIVIFPAERHASKKFEAWEHVVVVEGDNLREGLKGAVALSRSVFDDPDRWKPMGYWEKPILYVVPSIQSHNGPKETWSNSDETRPLFTKFSTFNWEEVEALKTLGTVLVPVNAVYFEE